MICAMASAYLGLITVQHSVLNVKVLEGIFIQEKALVASRRGLFCDYKPLFEPSFGPAFQALLCIHFYVDMSCLLLNIYSVCWKIVLCGVAVYVLMCTPNIY